MNGTMSSGPLVSVIIPNYNHAPYLKQRIDSVLQQTFQDFEVIILDDNSTDNSKEIIEQFRDYKQISQIVYNDSNSGNTFKQWKKGLDLAKGEWIWIAESDDVADIEFIKKCVEAIKNDTVLVFTRSCIIDNNGHKSNYLGCEYFPNPKYFNSCEFLPLNPDPGLFLRNEMYNFNHIVNASSVLFKKSAAPNLNTFIPRFKLCGDWMFWIKVIEQGKIAYIDKDLNSFRTHSNTVRNNSENKIFAYFENAEITNYLYSKFGGSTLKKKYSDYLIYIYFSRYSKSNRNDSFIKFLGTIKIYGFKAILTSIKKRVLNA
jgi:glycosyltransferase involved in cell wall biosynthesis